MHIQHTANCQQKLLMPVDGRLTAMGCQQVADTDPSRAAGRSWILNHAPAVPDLY